MKSISSLIIVFLLTSFITPGGFLNDQLKYERVRLAKLEKENVIRGQLQKSGLTLNDLNILMVAYKDEDTLELYAKKKSESVYKLIMSYKICEKSGELGPKRKQGDNQVPEGFYKIDRFNPVSGYFLSLRLNYPNEADKIKCKENDPGGDIFIHGKCVTIGCLPMTDEKIKEIYMYAVYARNNAQSEIPVYVFPFRMTKEKTELFKSKYSENKALLEFWSNIKTGYDEFEKNKSELRPNVSKSGDYMF